MFYKLGKNLFHFIVDLIQFIRLILVFLSFAVILYWFFELGNPAAVQFIAPFFEGLKSFTHIFYNRTVLIDGMNVDFSFLVATILFMSLVLGLKFVVEYIEKLEEKYDSIYRYFKQKAEDIFNLGLEQQYVLSEQQVNKVLLMINIDAKNLLKDSFFSRDVNVGVDEMQKKILLELSESLEREIIFEKKFLNDGLLLYFKKFDDIENIIAKIEMVIAQIKHNYAQEKWQISYRAGVEVYAKEMETISKIRNLIMLVRLGLQDKIVCLSSFKQRYELEKKSKFYMEGCGVYTINEAEEEAFCVKKLR